MRPSDRWGRGGRGLGKGAGPREEGGTRNLLNGVWGRGLEGRGRVEPRRGGDGGGAWSSYEAAASHAESLGARPAGGTVQHAAEAVIEVVSLRQAVEVALVGCWGWEESVGVGDISEFQPPSCQSPFRQPSSWADEAQRLSQSHTWRLRQSQDWNLGILLPVCWDCPRQVSWACTHSFIHSFMLTPNIRGPLLTSSPILHSLFHTFIPQTLIEHLLFSRQRSRFWGTEVGRIHSALGLCTQQVPPKKYLSSSD